MARRTKDFQIQDPESRDNGKVFHMVEMSSAQAEKWAARALLALLKSGIEMPDDAVDAGLAGLAQVGARALLTASGIKWDDLEPLMNEMMGCVTFKYGPGADQIRGLVEEDIEEVKTRLFLRREVLDLHLGFSLADRLSTLKASAAEQANSKTTGISPQS